MIRRIKFQSSFVRLNIAIQSPVAYITSENRSGMHVEFFLIKKNAFYPIL